MKNNEQVKRLCRETGIPQWKVAAHLGIAAITLSRWLQTELSDSHYRDIVKAIKEIYEQEGKRIEMDAENRVDRVIAAYENVKKAGISDSLIEKVLRQCDDYAKDLTPFSRGSRDGLIYANMFREILSDGAIGCLIVLGEMDDEQTNKLQERFDHIKERLW